MPTFGLYPNVTGYCHRSCVNKSIPLDKKTSIGKDLKSSKDTWFFYWTLTKTDIGTYSWNLLLMNWKNNMLTVDFVDPWQLGTWILMVRKIQAQPTTHIDIYTNEYVEGCSDQVRPAVLTGKLNRLQNRSHFLTQANQQTFHNDDV